MLLISKIVCQLKVKNSISSLYCGVRQSSFLGRDYNENKFMRNVLLKTDGCSLFNPEAVKHLNNKDETVSQLVQLVLKRTQTKRIILKHCLEKHESWSLNTKLYILDAWHITPEATRTELFECLLSSMLREFNQLSNGPALQLMYYIAWSKRYLRRAESEIIVNTFEQNINALTFEEISIYCLALFKNNVDVRKPILEKLYNLLMTTELRKHEDIAVTGILKAVRHFSDIFNQNELMELQKSLVPFAKEANLISLTHVILLGRMQRVFNPQLVDIVLERFLKNLDSLRIKDIEKALLVISTMNRNPNEIDRKFCDSVHQYLLKLPKTEHMDLMERYIRCISFMVLCRDVDEKSIDWALYPRRRKIYGDAISDNELALLIIDSYAKINLANSYSGHRLSDRFCAELMQGTHKKSGKPYALTGEICEIFKTNGAHCILSIPIPYVPHPDIFCVYNKRTNQTINTIQPNMDGTIINASELHQNNPDFEAIAIIPCFQRQTVFQSNQFTGVFQMKLNQLQMLGFKTIVIENEIWKSCESFNAKLEFLDLELRKKDVFLLNKCQNRKKC